MRPERIPDLRLVAFTGIGTEVFGKFVGHVHEGIGVWGRRLFPRDVGPNGRVLAVEVEPLFEPWLCVGLDSVNRAFRLANAAIDAFVGVDDEHVLALVEAVHRTNLDAVHVLAANAALVDDVGQLSLLQKAI
jgi:hypothetical protein